MKLKKSSYTSRLYRWFYDENKMPNNLCPYFWKVVAMYVLILPTVVFGLPWMLWDSYEFKKANIVSKMAVGAFMWIGLFCALTPLVSLASLFTTFAKHSFLDSMAFLGCMVMAIAVIVGLVWYGMKLHTDYENRQYEALVIRDEYGYIIGRKPRPEKKWMIIEYIKAVYEKQCPSVEWDD
jgi:hypothetical protein